MFIDDDDDDDDFISVVYDVDDNDDDGLHLLFSIETMILKLIFIVLLPTVTFLTFFNFFLFLHFFPSLFFPTTIQMSQYTLKILGNITNLLVQMNAASNFFLYSFFSGDFRRTLKNLLCSCKDDRNISIVIETTMTGTPIRRPLFTDTNSQSPGLREKAYSTFNSRYQ